MKIKYSWIISLCLVAFVYFSFNVSAYAGVMPTYSVDSIVSNFESSHSDIFSNYKNIVYISSKTTDGYNISFFYSNSDILLTKTTGAFIYNSSSLARGGFYNSNDKWYYDQSSPSASCAYSDLYVIKGSNPFINGVSTNSTYIPPSAQLSDSDILNFNWQGNGLKIYNLEKDMKISGYMNKETGLKWFDIECYGKFNNSSSSWFSSFAKKSMQTKLQNNCYVTVGGETRHVGEGVGIKSFDWVDSDSTNVGSSMKFRMVLTVPMLCTGSNDVIVGTTIPDGSEYIKDTVSNINFLSNNEDSYGKPPVEGGSTSYVEGNSPGNSENYKNDDSSIGGFISIFSSIGNGIVEFFKAILNVLTSVGTIAPQLASAFSALFMFLPSPIPQLITTAFALVIFVAILHFLRG